MGKFKLVVFTDPVPGREDEYNTWYNEQHLKDVVAVPGIVSAQRFRLRQTISGNLPNRHLAIYEIEAENPETVMEEIFKVSGSDAMVISTALDDTEQNVAIFEPCSGVVS